jgi:gliding motility-associated-like protein
VEELLCPDEFIRVNGTIYDRLNPSGTEVISGVAANGCDSVVQVRLRFRPEARGRLERTLCADEFITLNGAVYDRFNPMGTEVIPGAAANGCDSVVQVRLDFYPGGVGAVQATLCPGETLEVNGALYDQLNPMGTEIIPGAAASGCDSLVEVQLDFYPEATGLLEQHLCPGESLLVNGTEYNEFNPEGAELLPGAAANGCDSILQIRLTFDADCGVSVDFFIPGGITPNGDGLNDRFVIPAIDADPAFFDNSLLIVSNRWGQVVYEAFPYRNDWSGDNGDGTPLPAGTYFYRFLYGPERETQRRGEVTIMR